MADRFLTIKVKQEDGSYDSIFPRTHDKMVLTKDGKSTLKEDLATLASKDVVSTHVSDDTKHMVSGERENWTHNTQYTNSTPMINPLGGIPAGTTFSNMPVHDLLTNLLYPYVAPAITLASNVSTSIREKGNPISSVTFTATTSKKSQNITKVEFFRNGSSIHIIPKPQPSGGQESFTYGISIADNASFTSKVSDSKSVITSNSIGYTFVHPMYIGALDSTITKPDQTQIKAMTKRLVSKSNQSYTYSVDNKRMAIACPPGWTIRSIIDPNGFDITNSFTSYVVSVTCLDSSNQDYTVYVSSPTSQTNFKVNFNI